MTPAPKLSLAALTSAEARPRLAANPVLLLPLGSLEEQGPQTPMGDFLLAERIALLIAERAGEAGHDTLVLPVLPFGGADYFGSVPGGISLGQATLRAVLRDVLDALQRHGLTRILVVNGHGGNAGAIHDETLALRHRTGTIVPSFPVWRIAAAILAELVGPVEAAARTGHGADPLGSVALHLLPALVRPDLVPGPRMAPAHVLGLPVTGFGHGHFDLAEIDLPVELDEIAPAGMAAGDPRACATDMGEAVTGRLVELGCGLIMHLCANGWGGVG